MAVSSRTVSQLLFYNTMPVLLQQLVCSRSLIKFTKPQPKAYFERKPLSKSLKKEKHNYALCADESQLRRSMFGAGNF